jgi:heme oxygenase (biliverdin-IX-beta and delta-forming)
MTLLALLRTATRERHAAIDSAVGPEVARSRASYGRFLTASLGAAAALEGGVERALGEAYRATREGLLRADLEILGVSAPVLRAPYEPANEADAFGCAYVLEGSALGGIVLAERVHSALGSQIPTAYLRIHGAATAGRWRWFLSQLEAFGDRANERARADACRGAIAGFDLYREAFAAYG